MSAIPEPCLYKPDAQRIRREIERLSQEQNKTLQMAMYVVMSPVEQNQYSLRHQQIVDLLRQLNALDPGKVSKLSARMVELSLQKAQRNPALTGMAQSEVGGLSSPAVCSSADLQRLGQPAVENAKQSATRPGQARVGSAPPVNAQQAYRTPRRLSANFAVLYLHGMVILRKLANHWSGSAAVRKLSPYWNSVKNSRTLSQFRARIAPLSGAAERSVVRQSVRSSVGHLSTRTARAAQFVADRISASHVYRCRDCGRQRGFRSHPRTFVECYILPLLLMQPVRCAACFRRDYWLIITRVRKSPDSADQPCTG